ncbi:MAG: YihY/virulence factor BrkB family protein [Alphaproteobacteria bacterium]|nr:MAG: YihY/virulence factor BrkB family protein [Alphaproteobacteria bacterium]
MHTPRSVPSVLAALAGFAIAVASLRWEDGLRRERHAEDKADKPPGADRASDEPRSLQVARAAQPGRGRSADAPTRIPARGWKDILWRTYEEISADRLFMIAAGVTFYAMLAFVPAITALVSLYGLFAKASTIDQHLSFIASMMPGSAYELIGDQITRIAGNNDGKLTFAFVLGLGVALWSANAGMKAIFDALNIVYDEDEKRGFIKLNLISLTFTLGAVVALLVAIGAVVALPLVLAYVGFGAERQAWLLTLLRWPALFVLVMLGLALLYRFGPSRKDAEWRWVSVGSVFASFAWLAISALFSWYLSKFADYNATYGSLGAVIGLMMWIWLSVSVILIGAELNAETEHQTARDTTVGHGKPLGARGAVMADTVGEAKS